MAHPECGSVLHGSGCRSFHRAIIQVRQQFLNRIFSALSVWKFSLRMRASSHLIRDKHAIFCFQFVGAGSKYHRAIVLRQCLIALIDNRFIAICLFDCTFEVIRDK